MKKYQEVKGNLIEMALSGEFDVIAHGCNCFCIQKAGIAKDMSETFDTNNFDLEIQKYEKYDEEYEDVLIIKTKNKGNINKLGQIDYRHEYLWFDHPLAKKDMAIAMNHKIAGQDNVKDLIVVNAYTQYKLGNDARYDALSLCLEKINHIFKGKHIGLPLIGCGIGGLIWDKHETYALELTNDFKDVKTIMQEKLKDCNVTIVHYQN